MKEILHVFFIYRTISPLHHHHGLEHCPYDVYYKVYINSNITAVKTFEMH